MLQKRVSRFVDIESSGILDAVWMYQIIEMEKTNRSGIDGHFDSYHKNRNSYKNQVKCKNIGIC